MNWKRAYIIAALVFVIIDFIASGGQLPSSMFRFDHDYHMTKFELVREHGLTRFSELGDLPVILFSPPLLMPFLYLGKVLPVPVAHFSTYLLILGLAYFAAKRIVPNKGEDVLLAILFPASLFWFLRFGRLLEMMAHLPFLILLYNLDKDDKLTNTGLFLAGLSCHIPTALFYTPWIGLRALQKKQFKQIGLWILVSIAWLAVFIPPSWGTVGWELSRTEFVYDQAIEMFNTNSNPVVFVIMLAFLAVTPFLVLRLGPEAKFAFPSFFLSLGPSIPLLFGFSILKFVPGFNQILLSTVFPPLSYLLINKNENLWKMVTLALIPIAFFPFPWNGPAAAEIPVLDQIDGNYTLVYPGSWNANHCFVNNYLVMRGLSSPFISIWEFNDPERYFFDPQNCSELATDTEYVIMPIEYSWAKSCGEYIEGQDILVVKPNKAMQG